VRWLGLGLGLSVVALAVGIWGWWSTRFQFVALRTRALPGFEIKLPAGDISDNGFQYRDGRLTIHGTSPWKFSMQVTWEPGGLFVDEQADALDRTLTTVFEAPARPLGPRTRTATSGAAPTLSWAVANGSMKTWVTQIECGARRLTMMTGSAHAGVEDLHRRVVASFRCLPDSAEERMIGDVPVVFDLGPGWFRQSREIEQLELTNRHTLLTARSLPRPSVEVDVVENLKTTGMPGMKIGDRVADDWRIEVTVDGEPLHGWLTLRDCVGTSQILLLMSVDAPDDDGRRWLARGRCRRLDEAPQTWPDLPAATAGP